MSKPAHENTKEQHIHTEHTQMQHTQPALFLWGRVWPSSPGRSFWMIAFSLKQFTAHLWPWPRDTNYFIYHNPKVAIHCCSAEKHGLRCLLRSHPPHIAVGRGLLWSNRTTSSAKGLQSRSSPWLCVVVLYARCITEKPCVGTRVRME